MPIEALVSGAVAGGAIIAGAAVKRALTTWQRSRNRLLRELVQLEGDSFHAGRLLQPGHIELCRPVGVVLLGHLPSVSGSVSDQLALRVVIGRALPPLHLTPGGARPRWRPALPCPRA